MDGHADGKGGHRGMDVVENREAPSRAEGVAKGSAATKDASDDADGKLLNGNDSSSGTSAEANGINGTNKSTRRTNAPARDPMADGPSPESLDSQDEGDPTPIPERFTYPPLTDSGESDSDREVPVRGRQQRPPKVGGVRWAPLDVPLVRRLQTLAVLMHCLMIAISLSLFCFVCAVPFLTWPFLIFYLSGTLLSTVATDGKLRRRWEFFRRLPVWRLFAGYFPATLHKTHDLPATRKYIFGYHPHGIISHGAFAAFATEALGFSDKFPGITNSLLTLDSNFRLPFYREYIIWMGLRSVSKESIYNILTRGGPNGEGMGRAVTIVVGGARESLAAQPGTLNLVLRGRKGFIRVAIRTGADLVPVLAFGENDLYHQLRPEEHPMVHRFQMLVLRFLKFTLPFLHGRGIFNYDVGLMPYRRPLNIVVGAPIRVAQQRAGAPVDPAEVDRLHDEYVAELQRIWDTYKDRFAKGRKSEMEFRT